MLILNKGQTAKFKFIFTSDSQVYDPTGGTEASDIYFSVVRGDNGNGPIVDGPFSFIKQDSYAVLPGISGSYISAPDSNFLDINGAEGIKFLSLPGVTGNYVSVPHSTALNVAGDIELVCRVALDDWTPSSISNCLIAATQSDPNRKFRWSVQTNGIHIFEWWPTGSVASAQSRSCTPLIPLGDGVAYWLKVTLDINNNSGGCQVKFYYAPDSETEPTTWNDLGAQPAALGFITSIYNATAPVEVGSAFSGSSNFSSGKFYRAIVRNGIDGAEIVDIDFTSKTIGSSSFSESTGKTVTVSGSIAKIVDGTTYGTRTGVTVAGGWSVTDNATAPSLSYLDLSDFEVTIRATLDKYVNASNQCFVGKYTNTGPSRSYLLGIDTAGKMFASYTIDNSTILTPNWGATVSPFVNGKTYWFRYRRNSSSGQWFFDYAADQEVEPTTWTNVGGAIPGTSGTLYNSDTPFVIGAYSEQANGYASSGRFYRVIARNAFSSGTKVLDVNFTRQIQFATSFIENSGNNLTVNTLGTVARIERNRDLELVVRASLTDWTNPTTNQTFIGKYYNATPLRSYLLAMESSVIRLFLSYDGQNLFSAAIPAGTMANTFIDGRTYWIKATLASRDSTGGYRVKFYYAQDQTDEPVSWTLLTDAIGTYSLSLFPGTAQVEIGGFNNATQYFMNGKMYRAIIRNGIDGPTVADFAPYQYSFGKTSYVDQYNNTWTLRGSAAIAPSSRATSLIERTNKYEFTLNYTVPTTFFEANYSIIAQTTTDLTDINIVSQFQVKGSVATLSPSIAGSNKSAVINYKPLYQELNQSNTSTVLLLGHADGIGLNDPVRIRSVQSAIDLLGADLDSPLLRGVFDAYEAGARDIIICAVAPMSEYVYKPADRISSTILFDLAAATPASYTFYQKYYQRLAATYSVIGELDFVDYVVPLEASILATGGVDFITQLANYLSSFHNDTGYVQLGVIGSRSNGISSSDVEELASNPLFVNKFTQYSPLDGNITSDIGRFVIPIYGEVIYQHAQLKRSYPSSMAAAFAGMLSAAPMNMGLIRTRVKGATAVFGADLAQIEMNRLDSLGINTVYRGKKTRRSVPFEVYVSNENTMASSLSTLSKASQMRLVARVVSEVRGFSYEAIGKFGYDKVVSRVRDYLNSLRQNNIILDFAFNVEVSQETSGKLIFHIELLAALGLRQINFAISTGPGV
jgi:hypothetical protein